MSSKTPLVLPDLRNLYFGLVVVTVGGALLFVTPESWGLLPKAIGGATSTVGLIWLMFRPRCPSCSLRLIPHAIANQAASDWLQWLLNNSTCPKCGFSHES
jgi:hypothetical protein